ncbi:MAG TPA: hypothetical protein VKC61_02630 [Pyrinomonadaceae bacterium]|nr:hypothetical protein [Pyrinomonadaceae bacterium]
MASLAMVALSLVPQFHLWLVRGRDWNGAYVSPQGDEPLYSAYINALIDGRSRKNDPFGGKDSTSDAPLPESTFSIQFLPAYVIALPARAFGISASTAFIVLIAAAALFASLSVFGLLKSVTGDVQLAAAGTIFVLCLGCIVGRYGLFGAFFDIGVPALPFLRRYQPAAAFPLFFVFLLLVWQGLTSKLKPVTIVSAVLAGATLAALVFSYLYLWTGAAAWLACIGGLWFYFLPSDRRKTLLVLTTVGGLTAVALIPYFYLLSHRPATLDEQQTMTLTHSPDLLRVHEILGAAILVALVVGIRRKRIAATDSRVLLVASLALLPFIVFNQQILTGKTMQAFHYEISVVNYSTLVALLVTLTLFWKPVPRRLLVWITALSFVWGLIVVALPARLIFVPFAVNADKSVPVLRRLKELSKQDGTLTDLQTKGQTSILVFSPSVAVVSLLPTWTSQGTLLDVGGVDFGSVTREERKQFFYMHLYYSNVDLDAFRRVLNGAIDPTRDELSTARSLTFGHERTIEALTPEFKPVQPHEVERELQAYQAYANSFTREEAVKRPLTYAVIPVGDSFKFANLDRWYERDSGETAGAYKLYRLKLRD